MGQDASGDEARAALEAVARSRHAVVDELELSDSALSKPFATLESVGYVVVERPATGRRRQVTVRLTPAGRQAFAGHVAARREIVAAGDPSLTL